MPQTGDPRLDPRLRARLRIDVTPRWDGAVKVRMETSDLSGTGAALQSPIFLPLKTQVFVELELPPVPGQGAIRLRCEAVVVNIEELGHERAAWRAGIFFLNLSEPDQRALRRFVYSAREAPAERRSAPAAQGGGETR